MVSETETIDKQLRPSWEANLSKRVSWKPGQSGNPSGRAKKESCLTSVLKEELGKIPEQLPNLKPNSEKLTWAQILGAQAIQQAAKGNSPYYKEILDRVEGKVVEKVEQTIKNVTPIRDMTPEERKTRIKDLLKATNRN